MAVTSDAVYSTGTGCSSFMPSNVYYGCVPHCRNENQHNNVFEHVGIAKPPVFDYCSYDTAMETEDEGLDYPTTPVYSINESVILEASLQNRLQGNNRLLRCQEPAVEEKDTFLHTSRKRCNSDISPTSWPKKFRRGSGKDHVHSGRQSTEDHGLATVSHESEALQLGTGDNNMEQSMITSRNCCWPADENNFLNSSDCKQLLSDSGHTPIEKNIEYESILFGTHGCSVYQFHRLQLSGNGCIEEEF